MHDIVGDKSIRVHSVTSDNEAAIALSVDFLTNYVGQVSCAVHSFDLCAKKSFYGRNCVAKVHEFGQRRHIIFLPTP